MSSTEQSTSTAERLRTLAEWLDAHPLAVGTLSALGGDWTIYHSLGSGEDDVLRRMTEIRRSIGGLWRKEDDSLLGLVLHRTVLPGVTYKLYAPHEAVCQRVVVDSEEVEVDEPDPDAVAALPTVKRTVTRERVEWLCPEILIAGEVAA